MARIFYFNDKGTPNARPIYGVHPDGNIDVPANVSFVDVVDAPEAIAWPESAHESECVINEATGALSLKPELAADYYQMKRKRELPDNQAIINALYADIQAGHFGPDAANGQFYQLINALFNKYPKPV